MEGNYFNIIKATFEKPTANIIFNMERLKVFPVVSGPRQGFNTVLDILARAIR